MKAESRPPEQPPAEHRPCIGVGVMLWKGDYLLLGQRIDAQGSVCWQFPGGRLEAAESVLECAAREVREETGLAIGFARPAGFNNLSFAAGERDYITLYVSAAHQGGEPEAMEPDKCRSWQWFHHRELPEPLFLPITHLLKQSPDLSVFKMGLESSADGPADGKK